MRVFGSELLWDSCFVTSGRGTGRGRDIRWGGSRDRERAVFYQGPSPRSGGEGVCTYFPLALVLSSGVTGFSSLPVNLIFI